MRLILNQSNLIARWVADHLGHGFDHCAAIGVATDKDLLAGAVYSNYRGFDIEFNIYSKSPKWCTREILKQLLYYPFVSCGVERMSVTIAEDDHKTRKLAEWIGFDYEGLVIKGYDGKKNAILMGILKETVFDRWLNNGKEAEGTESAGSNENSECADTIEYRNS